MNLYNYKYARKKLASKFTVMAFMALLCACSKHEETNSGANPAKTQSSPLTQITSQNQVAKVTPSDKPSLSLVQAKANFSTKLIPQNVQKFPLEKAPEKIFLTTSYPTPLGRMAAYLTPDPKDGKKHPAIIWITGGDNNSISDVWSAVPQNNDQTASAYRQAGIISMFPSQRGGNDNPGAKEGFLGEVDDILAAADYLAKQPYVDAKHIYLGGHSTGGTLALLVAESSARFRGIFAFGAVDEVAGYGSASGFLPFDISNQHEVALRSPIFWLSSIHSPTWLFEGTEHGNLDALQAMQKISSNPAIHFFPVEKTDHFGILAPVNSLIAQKILQDSKNNTYKTTISFTNAELNGLF